MFRQNKIYIYFFLLLLVCAFTSAAEVTLPKVIGSNMVLQRNKIVLIWGTASAGEKIKISFGKQQKSTVADTSGKWIIYLDPLTASSKPGEMIITGTNTLKLQNILVGDVWLCSGQSNMEYTMAKSSKYADAVRSKGLNKEQLAKEQNSNIRLFLVKRDLNKPGDINKGWNEAKDESLRNFSAAGYYFAKTLYEELQIPIGVISSAIPGSAIEPWMSATPLFQYTANEPQLQLDENIPGKFYPTLISPLAPFSIKGFLWYQGETNCFQNETIEYTYKFKHLIQSWRQLWKDENLPFYFVQIAPFYYSKSKGKFDLTEETLPLFREAQAAALQVPNTGMIVTTDLVDNPDDIHPTYKWEVGRRLALLALSKTYDEKVLSSGPQFKEMTIKGNKAEITFSNTGSGLISADGKSLNWFSLAGNDGVFHSAVAILKGNKVIVSSSTVLGPVHVRFAWNEAAQPNLFNKEGLPAAPFRTDKINTGKIAKSGGGFQNNSSE